MPVSPAVAPPPGNPRFPLADSIRGLAVLLVVFCHAAGLSGAVTAAPWGLLALQASGAVTLFFVLSGFLLYRPYASAHAGLRPPIALGEYLRRRALRILPAYWVALTALALWPGLRGVFSGDWWIYYGLVQNLSDRTVAGGIPVAWSLCVEVAFYLLLPLLATIAARAAARRRPGRLRADLAVIAAFGGAGLVLRALEQADVLPDWVRNALPGVAFAFAVGMAAAVGSVAVERRGGLGAGASRLADRAWLAWGAAAVLFVLAWQVFDVLAADARPNVPEPSPGRAVVFEVLIALTALLLMAPAVAGRGGVIRRLLAARPLAYAGLVSYGVFLWHLPLGAWLAGYGERSEVLADGPRVQDLVPGHETAVVFVAMLAASLAVATLSYRFVELPFLRRKPGLRAAYAGEAATSTAGASPAATAASSRAHVRA